MKISIIQRSLYLKNKVKSKKIKLSRNLSGIDNLLIWSLKHFTNKHTLSILEFISKEYSDTTQI